MSIARHPEDDALRRLDVALPACPATLGRLMALMADDDCAAPALAAVVADDLPLSAALIRAVNSAMFGVLRRVETIAEAVVFLGMREVAAITCEISLRQSFPATAAMNALWDRARGRGQVMQRAAHRLGAHPWRAQTAGLFAELGQAALMAHDPARHAAACAATPAHDLTARADAERACFGVDQAVLGASLCRAWGLSAGIANYVRDRPWPAHQWGARDLDTRQWLMLGAAADARLPGGHAHGAPSAADRPDALAAPAWMLGLDLPWTIEQVLQACEGGLSRTSPPA